VTGLAQEATHPALDGVQRLRARRQLAVLVQQRVAQALAQRLPHTQPLAPQPGHRPALWHGPLKGLFLGI
ncbi:jg22958, partial [Pararge aegeria aegeria]